jgi:hypothetical protein
MNLTFLLHLVSGFRNCGAMSPIAFSRNESMSKLLYVKVTLQLTVSQSLCQVIEPILGLVTRYYFLSEGCFLKFPFLSLWGALSDERSGLSFVLLSLVIYHYLHQTFDWITILLISTVRTSGNIAHALQKPRIKYINAFCEKNSELLNSEQVARTVTAVI